MSQLRRSRSSPTVAIVESSSISYEPPLDKIADMPVVVQPQSVDKVVDFPAVQVVQFSRCPS